MANYGDYRIVKSGETAFLIEEWKRVWWKLWLGGAWKYLVTRYDYELALATVQYLKDSKKPDEVIWQDKKYRIVKRFNSICKEDFSIQEFCRQWIGDRWIEINIEYKLETAHDFIQVLKDKEKRDVVWQDKKLK